LALFQYIGHYERFIEGAGAVKCGDVIFWPISPPGYEWIAVPEAPEAVPENVPVMAPEINAEPVPAPPATNETPATPSAPEAVYSPIPASASVAAVVH
jgi:hypothetical protein